MSFKITKVLGKPVENFNPVTRKKYWTVFIEYLDVDRKSFKNLLVKNKTKLKEIKGGVMYNDKL